MNVQRSNRGRTSSDHFMPAPQIPASPARNDGGSSHSTKMWEKAHSKFLSRGKNNGSPASNSSGDRSPLSFSSDNSKSKPKKKKNQPYSFFSGSKRLVTKTADSSVLDVRPSKSLEDENNNHMPRFPSLKNLSKHNQTPSYEMNGNSFASTAGNSETAVRGGSVFTSVFGRSKSNDDSSNSGRRRRRTASTSSDDLDTPLRNGIEKSSSSPQYRKVAISQTISEGEAAELNGMLESASFPMPAPLSFGQRSSSWGTVPHHPLAHSQSRSVSMGQLHQPSEMVVTADGYRVPVLLPPMKPTQLPEPNNTTTTSGGGIGSLLSQQMQDQHTKTYRQQRSEPRPGHESPTEINSSTPNTLDSYLSDPSFVVDSSPNSLIYTQSPMLDYTTKKAFTKFHNDRRYNQDSTEAFLGGDLSSSFGNMAHMSHHLTMARGGPESSLSNFQYVGSSDRYLEPKPQLGSSFPMEPFDEQNIKIERGKRLLKPVQGVDKWQTGRRYLIAPAALSYCSLAVINKLSGDVVVSAEKAALSTSPHRFGTVDLGDVLMTYVGNKHHLSMGKWSSCHLVLRQNYLLEFDNDIPITGLPRGFVHLEYASAYPSKDFPDSLELHFFASPCAKADPHVLLIRAAKREERDYLVKCLNDAAQLRVEDMWNFNSEESLGLGRYASVLTARRKDTSYFENREQASTPESKNEGNKYALKIVDKNEFWRRVVKGKERSDTLVRELSVQSTMTAKCGRIQTFLKLTSFFETSNHVVMELELLEGMDLFRYVSMKGMLEEAEAALIIEDILKTLDAMNRIGLVHRDIKPANILMCDRERDGVSIKVGDFGMATFVGVDGLVRGRCGTPGYVAPEILKTSAGVGYGNQIDVFSAGITLYILLCGYEPYYGETEKALIEANTRAAIEFPESDWRTVSHEARDLIRKMTKADPNERINTREALKHPWITRLGSKQADATSESNIHLASSNAPEAGSCSIS